MATHSRAVVSQEFPVTYTQTQRRNKGRLKYAPSNQLSFSPPATAENDHDLSENVAFVTYVTLHPPQKNTRVEIKKSAKKLEVTAEKWFHKQCSNNLHPALHLSTPLNFAALGQRNL
jgi:hypothetical protein